MRLKVWRITILKNLPATKAALTVFLFALAATALAAEDATTTFNWAFVKQAANGAATPIDFRERVNIAPGELFKIHVQPLHDAFIYLFLLDASGNLQVLFPLDFSLLDSPTYENTGYFIPDGDHWFTLDSTRGTERFYLMASSERLRALESLVLSYNKAAAASQGAARQAVLDEIASVRRKHSQLTVAAEKPVTIAGGTRGINATVEKLATRIEAPGFYYKLFRLEH